MQSDIDQPKIISIINRMVLKMIKIKKTFYLTLGLISLMLGIAGIFLPLLPTTCFILLAAFCFSKSSERLYNYLVQHRLFGRQIKEWQEHGVIPLRIKLIASGMMLLSVSYPLIFIDFSQALKLLTTASIVAALLFIWTRPCISSKSKEPVFDNISYPADFEMLQDSTPPAA